MKPSLTILFRAVVLLLTALCTAAVAADPSISAGSVSATAGGPAVTIPLNYVPGTTALGGTQFIVKLPPNVVYDSFSSTYATPAAATIVALSPQVKVQIVVQSFSLNPPPMNPGTMGSLSIRVNSNVPAGTYPIEIESIFSSSTTGAPVVTGAVAGLLTVGGGSGTASYLLGGSVKLANGSGLANVLINGGSALGVQTTNSSGAFSFGLRPVGTSYSLTPSLNGYQFSPAVSPFATLNGNTNVDFIGTPITTTTYNLGGRVTSNGAGLSGVRVDLVTNGALAGFATTLGDGTYNFFGIQAGTTYVLTPSFVGQTFIPTSRNGQLNQTVTNADFATTPGQVQNYTLSGSVTFNGSGLAGVRINGGALGDLITGTTGTFSYQNVPANFAFTITPSLTGYTFTPAQQSGTVSNSSVSLAPFVVARCTGNSCPKVTYSVAGTVTYNGQGLPGASVRIGRSFGTTAADGSFVVAGVPRGTYYAKVVFPGINFSPMLRRISLTSNVNGVTFTGKCSSRFKILLGGKCEYPRYTVSGRVTMNGNGIAGVRVRVNTSSALTDANGSYSLPNIRAGQYFPSASLAGYSFKSSSNSRIISLTQDTTLNYSAVCRAGYVVGTDGKCTRYVRPRVVPQVRR